MVLDAHAIGDYQACHRKGVLSRDWRPQKWPPKRLWDACFRSAVISIVQQAVPPAQAAADARARFLQAAANPGLDITTNPFLAAKDWCAMLDTTLRSMARAELPPQLREVPPVRLNSGVEWLPLAQSDGQSLHRFISVDRWDDAARYRELHSWRVMGDVAVTGLPMILHIVEIGQMRSGRRASLWARAWKHPTMPSLSMRFKGKLPGAFKGWKPLYLSDSHVSADDWVEQMWKEGAAQDLLHQVQVKVPQEHQRAAVVRDVLQEAIAIRELTEDEAAWSDLPMSRNACDGIVPCEFQSVCYSDGLIEIEKLGFRPRLESPRPRPSPELPAREPQGEPQAQQAR